MNSELNGVWGLVIFVLIFLLMVAHDWDNKRLCNAGDNYACVLAEH